MNTNTPSQSVTIPPELQRSLPREVALSGQGIAVIVIALVLAVGGFVAGALLSAQSKRQRAQFAAERANAVSAQATVTGVSRAPGKEDRWRVRYDYAVGAAQLHGSTSMSRSEARPYHTGQQVRVDYVRDNPGRSWIADHPPRPTPPWLPLVVAPSLLLPGVIIFFSLQRQRSLLERGRPAIARVTKTRRVQGQHGSSAVRVWFQFTTLSGAAQQARGSIGQKGAPTIGSDVVIVYDADNPRRASLYPLQLVKVRRD